MPSYCSSQEMKPHVGNLYLFSKFFIGFLSEFMTSGPESGIDLNSVHSATYLGLQPRDLDEMYKLHNLNHKQPSYFQYCIAHYYRDLFA